MQPLLRLPDQPGLPELITLGLHHEQQHQELLLMDIKHVLSRNPLHPVYLAGAPGPAGIAPPKAGWLEHAGGPVEIGHRGQGFGFDNEFPVHTVHLTPFGLADRPVTCGEWLSFMEDDGYGRPEFWLSDGWAVVNTQQWEAPLYWSATPTTPIVGSSSRCRASGPSIPTSRSATSATTRPTPSRTGPACGCPPSRNGRPSPRRTVKATTSSRRRSLDRGSTSTARALVQRDLRRHMGMDFECVLSVPGFRAAPGAVGEYNGKFMVSQYVLRGGCCATPAGHVRPTYRNFFPPGARWEFGGLRLARDP